MEEDLAKDEIVLKAKKPRSQKQIDAFETARAIRMENSKLKKEGISKVKEDVKNRNKVEIPSLPKPEQKPEPEPEPEIVIVKNKKKPKVIYIDGSSDEEPEPIRVKKDKVSTTPIVDKIPESAPLVISQPIKPTIRFC